MIAVTNTLEFCRILGCPSVTNNSVKSATNNSETYKERFAKRFPGIESNYAAHPERPASKVNFKSELFAAMFEHVIGSSASPSYQVEPELEYALDAFTSVKSFMNTFVHQSHTKVN